MPGTILIIDAGQRSAARLRALLTRAGFAVLAAADGQAGMRLMQAAEPDLILLDANLPGASGWEACRRLRQLSDLPIILVGDQNDAGAVVKALDELRADDYLSKPVDDAELLARIRARLRRTSRRSHELAFRSGDLRVDFLSREVWVGNSLIRLTPKEFSLLAALARHAGRALDRRELVAEAWGQEYGDAGDSVKLYIHYLRRKLEADPERPALIQTVRGVGYRLVQR